jgi:Xylose isomerase-like TIM barrel
MAPALLATQSSLLSGHPLVGCSTGYMESEREEWDQLVVEAAAVSGVAAELSALSERELPSLVKFFAGDPQLPFRYLSVHGPSKGRRLPERDLANVLAGLPRWIDAIVMHPDTIDDAECYRPIGRRLVLENMDARKDAGRTVQELEPLFEALPDAGLCFDIAHAKSVDQTMDEGEAILGRYGSRLRHVHLSSLDEDSHHVPLSPADEELYSPLLQKCRDVPWILEAPAAS